MTDWTRVTPETLAELRRLYEVAFSVAAPENDWEEWTSKAAEAFPALLDAAAERDALAATVERVRALHKPYYPFRDGRAYCGVCEGDPYPCQTIRALDAETGGESCGSVSAWLLDIYDIYRDGAAVGWDACMKALRHEDGTPVEIVSFTNPYRTGEE